MKIPPMLKGKIRIVCAAACLVLMASCSKKERVIVAQECHPQQTVIRTASNEQGIFGYSDVAKFYTIAVESGNATAVYLICNPPATLPAKDAAVTFSGAVRPSTISGGDGITYYELTLTTLN
ncbi:MAG: hypothetical protein INR69_05760 [Mucilaginibacter polytrichastri]|nr:hypothetical protein [Mucilaginibacter polytrichastri]